MRILIVLIGALAVAGCSWPQTASRPAETTAHRSACVLRRVAVPNPGGGESGFRDIAAPGGGSAWAVGAFFSGHEGGPFGPVVEHWNRSRWHVVHGAVPPRSLPQAVRATSPRDVWIAGSSGEHVFIRHWDGRTWSPARLPVVAGSSGFQDIDAINDRNVWAVGESAGGGHGQPLVMHWDGQRWTVVPAPPVTGDRIYAGLDAVTAIAARDIWAVGAIQRLGVDGPSRALVEHWNGQAWTVTPTPHGAGFDRLSAVSAVSPDSVWAFGDRNSAEAGYGGGGDHPLAMHWNGQAWRVIRPPQVPERGIFYGSIERPAGPIAVGDQGVPPHLMLIARRGGGRWQLSTSQRGSIAAAAATPSGSIWLVGSRGLRPLALRC